MREIEEPVLATRDPKKGEEMRESAPAVNLSWSWADYLQALTLTVAHFRRYFFFFNCLFFS